MTVVFGRGPIFLVIFFDSISSIAVGVKLIRQVDIVDSERVSWFEGLTSEFAGVFEGVLQKNWLWPE